VAAKVRVQLESGIGNEEIVHGTAKADMQAEWWAGS